MLKTPLIRLALVVVWLLVLPHLALAQEATEEPSFQITIKDVVPPEACTETGWRITYQRTTDLGEYVGTPLWRYYVQTVNGDLNLVHYWDSGYSGYVQDYMLLGNPFRDNVTSSYYPVPLWSDTYEAETIEYILDGDAVIWETHATLTCAAGLVVAADVVSQPAQTTRAALPVPDDNLVLALDEFPIYDSPYGSTHELGTIKACQTFFISDIQMRRASIATYARESITGHLFTLSNGSLQAPLVDVAEDYGQPGGQPTLEACA